MFFELDMTRSIEVEPQFLGPSLMQTIETLLMRDVGACPELPISAPVLACCALQVHNLEIADEHQLQSHRDAPCCRWKGRAAGSMALCWQSHPWSPSQRVASGKAWAAQSLMSPINA